MINVALFLSLYLLLNDFGVILCFTLLLIDYIALFLSDILAHILWHITTYLGKRLKMGKPEY